jgi:Uma2 family endonuclease
MAETILDAAPDVRRRKLSVAEFHRMGEAGILLEDDRVELIEGELIEMTPIGTRHMSTVIALTRVLQTAVGSAALVSVQNPVRLGRHSEPQPDLALLAPHAHRYRHALPTAGDVLLLVEVADSSVDYDRKVKMPLYARHGVAEVWLVDLVEEVVEVHREPREEGYRSVTRHGPGETLAPLRLPALRIPLAEVLG